MRKMIGLIALGVLLALTPPAANCQTVNGNASVTSPTSGYTAVGSPWHSMSVSVSTKHWLNVTGAAANTTYTFHATYIYGVGATSTTVTNNFVSITTDINGEGSNNPVVESGTGDVFIVDGNGTGRAFASTNPTDWPMGFAHNNASASVDFATYGEG